MKTEVARIAAILLGLVVSAALQDASPALWGAKAPFLLALACSGGFPAALAAGFFADALGFVPFGCSTLFFAGAALALRAWPVPKVLALPPLAFCHVVWCYVWGAAVPLPEAPFAAALLAIPLGVAMPATVAFIRRHAGVGRENEEGGTRA